MATVKEEPADVTPSTNYSVPLPFTIDRYSSGSDNDAEEAREYLCKVIREEEETERAKRVRVLCGKADVSESVGKRQRTGGDDVDGSLSTLVMPQLEQATKAAAENGSEVGERGLGKVSSGGRQFWKAGDYEYVSGGDWLTTSAGMDHVRVHPRFLHSNATSHKWVLGAFAELLDNALDEVCNGATYVNIDTITNKKDGTPMLIVEDNGGGMDPDKMRHCMSLGYSAKSRIANTIGQYGNGFKTSTMRLGADVIVFSRCRGKDGKRPTQSIGLLSYTFLTRTGKEDIVVPMLDYERGAGKWKKLVRSTESDWEKNVDTIVQWSPFSSQEDLLCQFNLMTDHGTRVIIYNLWEDDQGQLELDFEANQHDIQIRGVNRDEKNIQMATQYPNSRHFLTFRHSLRSYASILYLRIPDGFRIILRGRDVEHHDILNDLMHTQEITYRPQTTAEGVPKDPNMCAVVTLGFVKDAIHHIDVQGFNVYHKNRLIKPFWRIWNACGSDGRGVIGLLEANFVEPAHDKQGFERTTVLSRLENRLVTMQKQYWTKNCQLVGYVQRGGQKFTQSRQQGNLSDVQLGKSSQYKANGTSSGRPSPGQRPEKSTPGSNNVFDGDGRLPNGHIPGKMNNGKQPGNNGVELDSTMSSSLHSDHVLVGLDFEESHRALYGDEHLPEGHTPRKIISGRNPHNSGMRPLPTMPSSSSSDMTDDMLVIYSNVTNRRPASIDSACSQDSFMINRLKEENCLLMERIQEEEERILSELQQELVYEQEMSTSLQAQIDQVDRKIKRMGEEQNDLIDIFSEERERRVAEEENFKKQLEEESNAVQDLKEKIATFERK